MRVTPFFTDFYQLSMAHASWKHGNAAKEAVFTLYFRGNPFAGGFTVCAGLEQVCEQLEGFHFSAEDTGYLATLRGSSGAPLFEPEFLAFLQASRFECDVEAIPEGTLVFPFEP